MFVKFISAFFYRKTVLKNFKLLTVFLYKNIDFFAYPIPHL